MSRSTVRSIAVFLALALSVGTGAAVAQTANTLVLSPSSGPPGSSVAASGVFAGHCGVRLFWDAVGGSVLGDAPASREGSFATTIVVPASAAVGPHTVVAVGLVPDPDAACAVETGNLARQPFEVIPSGSGVTATLALGSPQTRPGDGVLLDASGSVGEIASFDFDLDGNGTYETSCAGPRAVVVHNARGSVSVGVRVVSADGQSATDTVVLEIAGSPVPPPPDPDGGSATAFESGTVAGTCVDEATSLIDATVKTWYCPQTVIVGVAEATFRKWGFNGADADACFERREIKLPVLGFDIVTTSFVATKPSTAPGAFRQNPVLVNGVEIAHPESATAWYYNDVAINETFAFLYSSGKKPSNAYWEWQLSFRAPGHRTSFSSAPFQWQGTWDVSDPGSIGVFTFGSDLDKPFDVENEFLGLTTAEKQTTVAFTAGHFAKLTIHVTPPFSQFQGVSLPTSSVKLLTENNGGHPVGVPAGAGSRPYRAGAPPQFDLEFTGIKLGMFSLDASLSYQDQAGDDVWAGGMDLTFPGGVTIGGTLVIRNGAFESAHFEYHPGPPGIGPVGCCVWIYDLFGDLTTISIGAGANFGIGPVIPVVNVPAAAVTGGATIFYGDPWAFVLDVSNLKIAGITVNANADVVISSSGFLAQAFVDEDWGPLELQANVAAKVSKSTWFASGGGSVCVDLEVLEGCGGGYAGIGKNGIAGCAEIPYLPDGGVALDWEFFTGDLLAWDMWWGCGFGDVQSEVSSLALSRARASAGGLARVPVRVPAGSSATLFTIEGDGAPPKVTLTDPDGVVIGSAATEPVSSGPGWTLVELPHDDTTYVTVEDPGAGTWQVSELPGSASIESIGLAQGHPNRIAKGSVEGNGRTRVLHYDVADIGGVSVTFVERGGDPASADPSEHVDRVLGTIRGGGAGTLRFTPAEGSARRRTIEAQILVDGVPVETETIASFTATRLEPLRAPRIQARAAARALLISWSAVPGAFAYRVVVDRSDGDTDVFDVDGRRIRVGGVTSRTRARITVQAFTEAGYLGEIGVTTVRGG